MGDQAAGCILDDQSVGPHLYRTGRILGSDSGSVAGRLDQHYGRHKLYSWPRCVGLLLGNVFVRRLVSKVSERFNVKNDGQASTERVHFRRIVLRSEYVRASRIMKTTENIAWPINSSCVRAFLKSSYLFGIFLRRGRRGKPSFWVLVNLDAITALITH